ncbi:MAG: hypothetical protein AAFV28_14990 [Cyanobacteria bacterium J06635_13]
MPEFNSRVVRDSKPTKSKLLKTQFAPKLNQLDREFIGKQVMLLNHDEIEEWFEGKPEFWQENC